MHDEAPPAAPDDSTKRVMKRIVRAGVLGLVGGFLTTFVGAVLLGNGPSEWETLGSTVHRGGMILMLVGLAVVIFGYRWPSIAAFLDAPPAEDSDRSSGSRTAWPRDVHDLLDSLPPPPALPLSEPPPSASPTMHNSVVNTAAPSALPYTPPTANMPTRSLPTTNGTAPPPHRNGCLIAGWSVMAIVVLLAAIPYWLGAPRDAVIISFVFDSILLVALSIFALELSGRGRAVVVGALVPLAMIELVKTIQFFEVASLAIYGGRSGKPWELRIADIVLHLGLIVFALFGGFVHASIDFIRRRSQGPRR